MLGRQVGSWDNLSHPPVPWVSSRRFSKLFVFLIVLSNTLLRCDCQDKIIHPEFKNSMLESLRQDCPQIVNKIFENKVPKGKLNNQTISYERFAVTSMADCYQGCCGDDKCNVAFVIVNDTKINCYKVTCLRDDESCLPISADSITEAKSVKKTSFMVLVRPSNHESWAELRPRGNFSASGTKQSSMPCEVGLELEQCLEHEICEPLNPRSRNGKCRCDKGYARSSTGSCRKLGMENEAAYPDGSTSDDYETSKEEEYPITTTPDPGPVKITVSVVSKQIQLPTNFVTLVAGTVPESPKNNPFTFEWSLTSVIKPGDDGSSLANSGEPSKGKMSGTMKNSNGQQLKLTDLEQGNYEFKVKVTGTNPKAYGEATGSVAVLPPKHKNEPPKAVLRPERQTINLPTSLAIIDASDSTDDGPKDDLTFKWEFVSKPLTYDQKLKDGPTLTLDELLAGEYTIKLTVQDKEGASDEATASIVVVEEKDFPPIANAGEDVIIYLPQRKVTLHGNQSYDDHGIVSWEWTRKIGQIDQKELPAADSSDMRTAFPTISNLVEGTYTFILKVTDIKGQTDTDEINVYVKPSMNLPPTANAGVDKEISLPENWILLDGSKSSDDIAITSYLWELLQGPNEPVIQTPDAKIVNVSSLTKGNYKFRLTVTDNLNNKDHADVKVVVNQNSNQDPRADAGDDFVVVLPVPSVYLNGSKSHDDLRIAKWLWTRQAKSLSAGKVVGKSDQESVLMLVDLVPGHYAFQLKVWDDQGKSSTDSVSFEVKENPDKSNVIQAIFNEDLGMLTREKLDAIVQGLELLLPHTRRYKVKVLDLLSQVDSGNVILHFLVHKTDDSALQGEVSESEPNKPKVASGKKVVEELNQKLTADSDILPFKVISLDTLVCQNPCSGHGICQQATRNCICDPFWLENFIRKQLLDGKSNCDWSIIYVGIVLATVATVIVCGLCYSSFKKRRRIGKASSRSANHRNARYSRLEQTEPGMELRNAYTSSLMISESDTDDEILYENSSTVVNGGVKCGDLQRRNGVLHKNSTTNA